MVPPAVARLSRVWFPSGGIAVSGAEDAHSKLIRAGFLRQSNAGMFHMLPLGRRVQDKVEGLVASHMEELLGESWGARDPTICRDTYTSLCHGQQLRPGSHCPLYQPRLYGRGAAAWIRSPPRSVSTCHAACSTRCRC